MLVLLLMLALGAQAAQSGAAQPARQKPSPSKAQKPAQKPVKASKPAGKLSPAQARKKFVVDVVRAAVALPQPDSQDRLRVLTSAAGVASAVEPRLLKSLSREGAQLETELVVSGTKPAVSMLAAGYADCTAAVHFIEMLPAASVQAAEESLLGALTSCPQKAFEPARLKLEAALEDRIIAPRPLLALMESSGLDSAWSQAQFKKMFANLPAADDEGSRREAPNFAAMYVHVAPKVEKSTARETGLRLLEWLSRVEEGGSRNFAVNLATDAMREALGEEGYEEALASNVVARSVAQTAGEPGEVEHEEHEMASTLEAMGNVGADRTEELSGLPSSLRAREAAAYGFANGTEGKADLAERYFEIAFAAANEVWSRRAEQKDAAHVIEEVSEAAAHVDPVAALIRAQNLHDPTAQAIGMLAVARVVVGQQ